MNKMRIVAALVAMAMLPVGVIPVMAADEKDKAPREYVVSEFVQSVGRNNLPIKEDQTETILAQFRDSDDIDEEYRGDVARAKAYTLVAGYEDGTLKPKANVRRIEAMVMLSRALPELEETSDLIEFTDVPEWAKKDMDRLTKAGLVYGYGDGTLGAEDEITVEQVGMLTDRSDEALNTTPVGDSFYGYANNKVFRNYSTSDKATIDPIHGAVIQAPNNWSAVTDRYKDVIANTSTELLKLVKGEIPFEDGTPEQRFYDMYYCYANRDEDADKDKEMFLGYRDRLMNAETPEDFVKEANAIYKETGVNVLYKVDVKTDVEDHIVYPYVALTAPKYASFIMYDNKNAETEKKYEEEFANYAKLFDGKFKDKDIKDAINLQKKILVNADYYEDYYNMRQLVYTLGGKDVDLKAEMQEIVDQHPVLKERRENEDENIAEAIAGEIKLTPEEANNLNDIKIATLFEEAGFETPDYIVLDKGDDEIYKSVKLTKSNLNAFKLNAVFKLSQDLNYTPIEEERKYLDIFKSLENAAKMSMDYHAVLGSPGDDSGEDMDMTEEELMDRNISALTPVMKNDIGMIFARREFTDEELEKAGELFTELTDAYADIFEANEWMDDATKAGALMKIANMIAVFGYPDNYGFAKITSRENGGTYVKNLIAIKLDEKDINKQCFTDPEFYRTKMWSSADELNAYYIPNFNTINVFAGIMGGAMYDKNGSDAHNLGSLGIIVGHEIGHAFDAHGSKYNERGEYKNWWTDESNAYYEGLKKNFVEYYKRFDVGGGVVQDSELTIGENMADFAGMSAVMHILKDDKEAQKEALMAFANMWARIGDVSSITSVQVLSDVHSSDNVRVDAVVASLPEFYELFDVKEGDKMYIPPEERLKLWR